METVVGLVGVTKCQETICTIMANVADRGLLTETAEELQPLILAMLLAYPLPASC